MKKRYLLSTGLTFSLVLGAAIGLAGCGEHTHSLDAVAKKDATCTVAGYEAYYKCSGCDKLFSDEKGETEITAPKEIAAAHKLQDVAKQDATCTEAGYELHYKCTVCNTLFSDAEGKTTIENPVAIPAAHKLEPVAKKDATCTEAGYELHYKCSVCSKLFSDEEGKNAITAATPIPVIKHTVEPVSKKRPTCTEQGYEEHYKCTVCNTLFSDEEGKTVIEAPVAIPAEHRLIPVAQKDATCKEDGYEAYYTCSICNKLFSDENGKNEITAPVVIGKTDTHTLGFNYTSENVPAPVAEGGKLASACTVCGKAMGEVDYKQGLTIASANIKNGARLEGAGKYYYQLLETQTRDSYFGFKAEKAGTYTISLTNVFSDENVVRSLDSMWILTDKFPTLVSKGRVLNGTTWKAGDADAAKWQAQTDIEGFVEGQKTNVTSITFTITEADLTATGSLYIMMNFKDVDMSDTTDPTGVDPAHAGSFLIDFKITEAQA